VGHGLHMMSLLLKLLRLNEVDEQTQSVFEQKLNCNLVLGDELGPHESVFSVLDEFSKVYHEAPREGSLGLQSLKEYCADLFLNPWV
jgi:hypothetical protein